MLQNKLEDYDIILSSASPRRKHLLEELGIKFSIQIKSIEEKYPMGYPVEKVAQYLSEIKAASFLTSEMKSNTLIITADTIVTLGKTILGKPSNYQSAANMLRNLSGKKHNVITGVTLRTINRRYSFSSNTEVYFKRLSNDEIDYYITNYKPYDKAGGYGIQEWIGHVAIKKIEGSYFNVMGLPTHKLYEELIKFIST
jgi:septum formation protein